ncbi:hypothetical protein BJV78DRAFT_1287661 [Lactifluus subvellereus]|nr:hypothetical protein BJV78DRAFT_1287661 [Lactifluus subvellereus]
MSDYFPTATYLPPIEGFGQRAPGRESQSSLSLFFSLWPTGESKEPRKIPHSPIHTLNNDALLNIFYLYRLEAVDEYDKEGYPNSDWRGQCWWYKLAQVCRWWRYLILESPSQLDLHLLCANGVPIANMLAHSPPLPLAIFCHEYYREMTEEDEEGILLALRHSDRVHYITLYLPTPKLQKIMTTMNEQFPILERMSIRSWTEGDRSLALLPRTFQAPHLRHLYLSPAALPIGSPLLTTTVGLVTLILGDIPPFAYFSPSSLLTRLSLMLQLETLMIVFYSRLPSRDFARQLLDTPIMTQVTLPNLHWFSFTGVSAYLEGLLAQISAPVLNNLQIYLFNQLTFTVPRLLQFMGTSETLIFSTVRLAFGNDFAELVAVKPEKQRWCPFAVRIMCRHLDWQVSSAAQILDTLQPVLSVVEDLVLTHVEHDRSSEWHNEVDRTLWRQLLRPFSNLKTLHVQNELIGKLAGSLQTDDGEPPLELLPNLEKVGYSGGDDARDAFTPFIDQRQVAGHPVNLTMVDHSEFSRFLRSLRS